MYPIHSYSKFWAGKLLGAAALLVALSCASVCADSGAPRLAITNACRRNESWNLRGNWRSDVSQGELSASLANIFAQDSAWEAYLLTVELRQKWPEAEGLLVHDYLESRAFREMGLAELAYQKFSSLVVRSMKTETPAIRLAAIDCLVQLHAEYPAFVLGQDVQKALLSFAKSRQKPSEIVSESVLQIFLSRLRSGAKAEEIDEPLRLLSGNPTLEAYAKATLALRDKRYDTAIQNLEYLEKHDHVPQFVVAHRNQVRLLLGRLYYQARQYPKALAVLGRVERDSLEYPPALSDRAWAAFLGGSSPQAVETSASLETRPLKNAFTPESLVVGAMVLNESCLFPEATGFLKLFDQKYRSSLEWLRSYAKASREKTIPLYPLAVDYRNGTTGEVPPLIVGEWLRSPLFIEYDKVIALMQKSSKRISELIALADKEQAKGNEELSERNPADDADDVAADNPSADAGSHDQLGRMHAGFAEFGAVIFDYEKGIAERKAKWVAELETELSRLTLAMKKRLETANENAELVAAEVDEGASQFFLWRNTHPDFERFAAKVGHPFRTKAGGEERSAEKMVSTFMRWDGEMRSVASELSNHCEDRDNYLSGRGQ